MGKIIILDENTANKIAAGEVIERPASLVKELVENSIDALATNITVEIKNGGIKLIKVIDNGVGVDEDDVEISFERHSTSKIRNADDLDSIQTMGFRGEALASIAAVSYVELKSRVKDKSSGRYVKIRGGVIEDVGQVGFPVGTSIAVNDLFFNTPARFKFLKKDSTEEGYISDILMRIALSHPDISIKFVSNNKVLMHSPGNNDLLSTIFSIYGKETAGNLCEINYSDEKVEIKGFAGKPDTSRSTRNYQSFFINKRYFRSKIVSSAIDQAYNTLLMKNKYAFIVMNIKINPIFVDVNVHPAKMEVKFSDEQAIFRSVFHAVEDALRTNSLIKDIKSEQKETYKFTDIIEDKAGYKQQKISGGTVLNEPVISDTAMKDRFNSDTSTEEKTRDETNEKLGVKENENVTGKDGINFGEMISDKINTEQTVDDKIPVTQSLKAKDEIDIKNLLEDSRIIGQVFRHIYSECNQKMVLIDQHAAHERIMYEKLKKKYEKGEVLSQTLLEPIVIELTNKEIKYIESNSDFFKNVGFLFENFGNNSIILREVPYDGKDTNAKEVFLAVLDRTQSIDNMDIEKKSDDILYTIACKAAVKANMRLDDLEIKNVLIGLSEIDNPYTCPHGRPTVVTISKNEAEKMFKRIV